MSSIEYTRVESDDEFERDTEGTRLLYTKSTDIGFDKKSIGSAPKSILAFLKKRNETMCMDVGSGRVPSPASPTGIMDVTEHMTATTPPTWERAAK